MERALRLRDSLVSAGVYSKRPRNAFVPDRKSKQRSRDMILHAYMHYVFRVTKRIQGEDWDIWQLLLDLPVHIESVFTDAVTFRFNTIENRIYITLPYWDGNCGVSHIIYCVDNKTGTLLGYTQKKGRQFQEKIEASENDAALLMNGLRRKRGAREKPIPKFPENTDEPFPHSIIPLELLKTLQGKSNGNGHH